MADLPQRYGHVSFVLPKTEVGGEDTASQRVVIRALQLDDKLELISRYPQTSEMEFCI